ncbi:MAG: hypothetical protein ACC683_13235, partial [Acidimicrobiia bacterium]
EEVDPGNGLDIVVVLDEVLDFDDGHGRNCRPTDRASSPEGELSVDPPEADLVPPETVPKQHRTKPVTVR